MHLDRTDAMLNPTERLAGNVTSIHPTKPNAPTLLRPPPASLRPLIFPAQYSASQDEKSKLGIYKRFYAKTHIELVRQFAFLAAIGAQIIYIRDIFVLEK